MKKITEKYFLDADRYNWIIKEKYFSEKFKEYRFRSVGFYSSLGSAGKALLEYDMKANLLDIEKAMQLKEDIMDTFGKVVLETEKW